MKKIFTLLGIMLIAATCVYAQHLNSSSKAYVTGISVSEVNNEENYQFTNTGLIDPLSGNNDLRNPGNKNDVSIFPNTVLYDFTLQLPGANLYNVSIMDTKGKVVMEENSLHDQVSINCQDLLAGEYYVRISDNTRVVSKRIIKQ